MSVRAWREEPVARRHNREAFDCGEPALNEFFRRYARQNHETGGSKTFVAVAEDDGSSILGYYSIRPGAVDYDETPALIRRGLGRYDVPIYCLARLAVDLRAQGSGLGSELFLTAARRCRRAADEAGGVAVVIDAKNERVAAWYASFGALQLPEAPLTLFLPLATIESLRGPRSRS